MKFRHRTFGMKDYLPVKKILATLILFCVLDAAAESHFEYYQYKVTERYEKCHTYQVKVCRGKWPFRRCRYENNVQCYYDYKEVWKTGVKCQTGWKEYPGNCDIPICKNGCHGGMVCTAPDICSCLTTGGICTAVPCSDTLNCYPGSCNSSMHCTCPPGFSGDNCLSFHVRPALEDCSVTIYDSQSVTHTAHCANPGQDLEPVWVNTTRPNKVDFLWNTRYEDYVSVPESEEAPHVRNAPVKFGVTDAYLETFNKVHKCSVPSGPNGNPPEYVPCQIIKTWNQLVPGTPHHLMNFTVSISGTLGGSKTGSRISSVPGSYFNTQRFIGEIQTSVAHFRFDLEKPKHCLTDSADPEQCIVFAVYIENDVQNRPVFEAKFFDWTDKDSGICSRLMEVYYLQPGTDGFLRKNGDPIISSTYSSSSDGGVFSVGSSGVYAVEVTSFDCAGNSAKARKIIAYDSGSKLTVNNDAHLRVLEAVYTSNNYWLNDYHNPVSGGYVPVTFSWEGRYHSNSHHDESWYYPVYPWQEGIDDIYGDLYGARSIAAVEDAVDGIAVHNVVHTIDKNGGRGVYPDNIEWINLPGKDTEYKLPITKLEDGDTVVFWVNPNDMSGSGNNYIDRRVLHVDKSPPVTANVTYKVKSVDEFTSSLYLWTIDEHSGLGEISYKIYDKTLGVVLYNDTAKLKMRDWPHSTHEENDESSELEPCYESDSSCYCVPTTGLCYDVIQEIQIDHCLIDKAAGDHFIIYFTVINQAAKSLGEKALDVGALESSQLTCRSHGGLSEGAIIGIVLGSVGVVGLVVVLLVCICRKRKLQCYPNKHRERSKESNTDNCSGVSVTKSSAYSPSTNSSSGGYESVLPDTSQMSTQSANRTRPAQMSTQSANRARPETQSTITHTTERSVNFASLYSVPLRTLHSEMDNTYSTSHKTQHLFKKFNPESVKLNENISTGHFAVIDKATVNRQTLAAKYALDTSNRDHVKIMSEKINFIKEKGKELQHKNIVDCIGWTINEELGRIILMELCENSLRKWMLEQHSVSEECALSISLNVATGLEHLHKSNVVHGSIMSGNILLVFNDTRDNPIAKLTGFGPKLQRRNKENKPSYPLEYFAIELLQHLANNPECELRYTRKTDAWNFAMFLCELYSNGRVRTFYPQIRNNNTKSLLEHLRGGNRTWKPRKMPEQLFQQVVERCWAELEHERPTFRQIVNKLDGLWMRHNPPPQYQSLPISQCQSFA